jgi:predicted nucleic acid-binding protein
LESCRPRLGTARLSGPGTQGTKWNHPERLHDARGVCRGTRERGSRRALILYIDTSVLASVYLRDASDADAIEELVFGWEELALTNELTTLELAGSFARAAREGRIGWQRADELLGVFKVHIADGGPIGITPINAAVLELARICIRRVPLRSLDAIHLAAASIAGEAFDTGVQVLTRDVRQAQAATALGLQVYALP